MVPQITSSSGCPVRGGQSTHDRPHTNDPLIEDCGTNVGPSGCLCMQESYCGLMPAALITFAHFAISDFM